jgi:glycosyltransferase involved in cell wall biosynthesis
MLRVLYLGYVWPEPRSSAAGVRTWNVIDSCLGAGFDVIFGSPCKDNEHRQVLEARGVRTISCAANDSRFDALVRELQPDFAIFDRFVLEEQFGWRVRENAPDCARIIDTQDLHSLRRARERALARGASLSEVLATPLASGDPALDEDLHRELASIYRSDLSWVISSRELEFLRALGIPGELLALSGFQYARPAHIAGFEERRGFAMIGNFRHPPNLDAARWLAREVWPRVRQALPHAELDLYGAYPLREATALEDPAHGVRVRGWTDDSIAALSRYRVNLAPLRFGAGIKGKISDGWAAGTPAVTTPIGAEGMMDGGGWGGTIGEDAESLAHAAVKLHEDCRAWEAASQGGLRLLAALFDRERNSRELVEKLLAVREDLARRRSSNLIGAMLWHHFHKSTTYFSRWIELKNARAPST